MYTIYPTTPSVVQFSFQTLFPVSVNYQLPYRGLRILSTFWVPAQSNVLTSQVGVPTSVITV